MVDSNTARTGPDPREESMPKTQPGKALRYARTHSEATLDYAAAYTQFRLGKALGISREQLRKMESNLIPLDKWNVAALMVLAELYEVTPETIIPAGVDTTGLRYLTEIPQETLEQAFQHSPCSAPDAGQDVREYAAVA